MFYELLINEMLYYYFHNFHPKSLYSHPKPTSCPGFHSPSHGQLSLYPQESCGGLLSTEAMVDPSWSLAHITDPDPPFLSAGHYTNISYLVRRSFTSQLMELSLHVLLKSATGQVQVQGDLLAPNSALIAHHIINWIANEHLIAHQPLGTGNE